MILETVPKKESFLSVGQERQTLTVFCDFDGPLVDVSDRYYNTYQLALEQTHAYYESQGQLVSLNILTKAQFWQMKQERVCDQEIALRSGLQVGHIPYFVQQVRSIVNESSLLEKDKFHQGVNWALARLHAHGVRLVVVTLRKQEQVRQILNSYGLLRLFSGVYGSSDETVAYQNNIECKTALLRKALAEHNYGTACMVGDTEADVLAAQAVGIPAIAVTCGIRSCSYLKQYQPDYIDRDLLKTVSRLLNIHNSV